MTPRPPGLSRRRLLIGTAAVAVVAVAGGGAWLWRPGVRGGALTAPGRGVMRAVARVVLEGSLPAEPAQADAALDRHLARLDEAIAGLPPATRGELSRLLALLSIGPARRWLTGLAARWEDATEVELEAALRRMRTGERALPQQAYHALRDLTNAAFYAQDAAWPLLGYPGPTPV